METMMELGFVGAEDWFVVLGFGFVVWFWFICCHVMGKVVIGCCEVWFWFVCCRVVKGSGERIKNLFIFF
jgi:hypothetical protein